MSAKTPTQICAKEGHLMWPRLTGMPVPPRVFVPEKDWRDVEFNNRPRFHAKTCLRCGWDNVIDPMLEALGGAA